jgi:trehalose 6-phosphate phosphatase
MKNILAHTQRSVLEELTSSNVLLAFDFDGTLAPIVDDPNSAALRVRTRQRLRALCELYPVIVISGRAQSDVQKRVAGAHIHAVVGNHGMEPWGLTADKRASPSPAMNRYARQIKRWLVKLKRDLEPLRGVVIEDKTYSLSVHYRQSRQKRAARASIMAAVSELSGARVVGGKLVVNITPQGAPHKGIALERERDRLRCDTALYVGDDDTDEDVFSLDHPGRLLSIRVGRKAASSAPYCVPEQSSVDELLRVLIELRKRQGTRHRAAE